MLRTIPQGEDTMKPRSRFDAINDLIEKHYAMLSAIICAENDLRELRRRGNDIDIDIARLQDMDDGEWKDLYGID